MQKFKLYLLAVIAAILLLCTVSYQQPNCEEVVVIAFRNAKITTKSTIIK
jgi:hypothetical protein